MKRVALGASFLLLLVPGSVWASGARSHSTSFRLVRADARVTLHFDQEWQTQYGPNSNRGRVVMHVKGKHGQGSLDPSGGKMRFPVTGNVLEHVRLFRSLPLGPLQTTCEQTRNVKVKGGVSFKRVGSKVKVVWKSPQSRVSFCPGPKTDSTLTSKMTKTYPASHFRKSFVTINLVGHSSEVDGTQLQATYKWRATLTLERVG